jgi:Protein of unknown function (DUF1194)
MRPRLFRRAVAAALVAGGAVLLAPSTAWTDSLPVDLELVLAVDVSLSMDPEEQRLQRDGYVEALKDADVLAAIRANALGRIGMVYVEWAGSSIQKVTVPWSLIDGPATAAAVSDLLAQAPILRAQKTSISGALAFAGGLFDSSGFKGKRRVIDVSGDGPNNDGGPVTVIRDALVAKGITINGLPIMIKAATGWFDLENLDEYYEDCVIGGFAAFSIPARDKVEFGRAIKRKLLLEIAEAPATGGATPQGSPIVRIQAPGQSQSPPPGATPPVLSGPLTSRREPGGRVDCLIGEKRWQQYMGGRRGTF